MFVWIAAARPLTLTAALVPVLVGSCLALHFGSFDPLAFFFALTGAVAIQIGTNFVNDAADCLKGADNPDRLGPPRMAAKGLLSPRVLFIAAGIAFMFASIMGLYLVSIAGAPILWVGVLSILAAIAYTAGPLPLAYLGLGDLFVFVFFGLVAVGGSFYVHTQTIDAVVFVIAALVGLQSVTIIAVNNTRDISTDKKVGKNTLSLRLGDKGARVYTALTIALPFIALPLVAGFFYFQPWILLPLASLPLAYRNFRSVFRFQGREFNQLLGKSALLQLLYGVLLSIGLILS